MDTADSERFPVEKFGDVLNPGHGININKLRIENILKEFAGHGAAVEDMDAAASYSHGGARSYRKKGMNDAGWNIWRGNYGVWLTQLSPDETSVGWWRVGAKDQPYGRFARAFEHASKKDYMGFALDTALWGGLPLAPSPTTPIMLRVVWFSGSWAANADENEDTGSFALRYDSQNGCKTAMAIAVGNSGRWEQRNVTVHDAKFGGAESKCGASWDHTAGADVLLVNKGAMRDVMFHMIGVERRIKLDTAGDTQFV